VKQLGHRLQMLAIRALVALLARLPLDAARRVGETLGRFVHTALGIRRGVVERQIAGAFPGLEDHGVRRIARASYEHFGRSVVEIALLSRQPPGSAIDWFEGHDDLAPFDDAVAAGNGLVAVTGHLGSWELAAAFLAARGHQLDVVARRMQNPLFDAYLTATRERYGVRVVYDDEAVRLLPRALREGRVIALVSDQGVKGLASAFVPFFGRPAKTPRGAAVFAYRFQVPAVFVTAVRRPSGKYWMHVREIPVRREPGGDRDAEIDAIVAAYTRILESFVRRYPEQYFWLHRRWRRQPPDTPAELRDPVIAAAES
jgi:Kdo2-lipid IVA lauroyltransferase/acyltransferase